MKSHFQNKVIVITGASSGLGRNLALMLAPFNCNIAAIGRNTAALESLKNDIEPLGSQFLSLTCDVSKQEDCKRSIDLVLTKWGRIDILINNAGFTDISLFHPDTHIGIVRNIMETNFFGAVYCTAHCLNSIITQNGSIVNISSVAGFSPLIGRTAYAASKHAMHGFFDTLRAELKDKQVHVMLVSPQFIKTNIRNKQQQSVENKPLTSNYVANKILKGIVNKTRFLPVGKTAIFAWWLNKFFPQFYEKLMISNQKKKFTQL
jgi:short-subunit dehydrogenase